MESVRLIAYSDYLCPWCYNGSVRLQRVEREFEGRVRLQFRSFLLRPHPNPGRDLEKFRAYTQSWQRPAAEPDGGTFRTWEGDGGPPTHSIPPHVAAKAAATLGENAFRRMHDRLLCAYFAESQDITDTDTLARLWREVGLPDSGFERREDPALLEKVIDEHNDAARSGVSGVPTVLIEGQDVPITGAHPTELYRRWIRRVLADAAENAPL